MLILDTAITIKSPSSGSEDKKKETKTFKLTPERKLWLQLVRHGDCSTDKRLQMEIHDHRRRWITMAERWHHWLKMSEVVNETTHPLRGWSQQKGSMQPSLEDSGMSELVLGVCGILKYSSESEFQKPNRTVPNYFSNSEKTEFRLFRNFGICFAKLII